MGLAAAIGAISRAGKAEDWIVHPRRTFGIEGFDRGRPWEEKSKFGKKGEPPAVGDLHRFNSSDLEGIKGKYIRALVDNHMAYLHI